MTKRWNVYQGEQFIGLLSAQEIRRALRDGTLDPFDMVAPEGSDNKIELVEVDEIFQEHTKPDQIPPEPAAPAKAPSPQQAAPETPPPERSRAKPQKASFTAEPTRSKERLAADMAFPPEPTFTNTVGASSEKTNITHLPKRIRSNTVSDKKKEKKFYLIDDKNRVLGPLSAIEVQSLFYRGILNKTVKVQKSGSDSKIPIRQFISAYSGKRMKALADQGAGKALKGAPTHPSTKVLNELYHLINSKKLAENNSHLGPSLGLIFLGIILGLIIYLVFDWKQVSDGDSQKRRPPRPALMHSDSTGTTQLAEQANSKSAPSRTVSPPPVAPPPPRPSPSSSTSSSAANPPPPVRRAVEPTRRAVPTNPPPSSRPQSVAKPAPSEIARVDNSASAAVSDRASRNQPRPANQSRQESGPIAQAMAAAGSVLSVGPVSFSLTELQNCELKCELTFRDAQGGQLTAIFFKGAYADQLTSRGRGAVTLTGSSKLEGGKLILFIQDIR